MRRTYEEHLSVANVLLKDAQYSEAIEHFAQALKKASYINQKIDVLNMLGRINAELGATDDAIHYFGQSIDAHNSMPTEMAEKLLGNKAVVLNNLATLYIKSDIYKAIELHEEALIMLKSLADAEPDRYKEAIANTVYSLAGACFMKGDFVKAHNLYEDATQYYFSLAPTKPELAHPLLAMTFFQLGAIDSERNKIHESRSYYQKSLSWYEKLMETHPEEYRPYFASVLNNLGVVSRIGGHLTNAKKYFQRTIEAYGVLMQSDRATFLPYYAASLNSLANIYADSWTPEDDLFDDRGVLGGFGMLTVNQVGIAGQEVKNEQEEKEIKEAEGYYLQALDIYNELADESPEAYTHYLATTLHNLGVLFDDRMIFDKAENYYKQALNIRRSLAEKEPNAFDFDVCVTQMNLVTLYQAIMERQVDISYKDIAEKLLFDTIKRLEKYDEKQMPPSIKNMLGDISYFKKFFADIEEVKLVILDLNIKVVKLEEEALSVADIQQKLKFYEQVIDLYAPAFKKYPENKILKDKLLSTYAKMVWSSLKAKEPALAQKYIDKGFEVDAQSPDFVTKEIYVHLLEGDKQKAQDTLERLLKKYDSGKLHTFVDKELAELGLEM